MREIYFMLWGGYFVFYVLRKITQERGNCSSSCHFDHFIVDIKSEITCINNLIYVRDHNEEF
jgi:hypothetical protein